MNHIATIAVVLLVAAVSGLALTLLFLAALALSLAGHEWAVALLMTIALIALGWGYERVLK